MFLKIFALFIVKPILTKLFSKICVLVIVKPILTDRCYNNIPCLLTFLPSQKKSECFLREIYKLKSKFAQNQTRENQSEDQNVPDVLMQKYQLHKWYKLFGCKL